MIQMSKNLRTLWTKLFKSHHLTNFLLFKSFSRVLPRVFTLVKEWKLELSHLLTSEINSEFRETTEMQNINDCQSFPVIRCQLLIESNYRIQLGT